MHPLSWSEAQTKKIRKFLLEYLSFDANPSNFKACHIISNWIDLDKLPAVIVKFLYLAEKDEICVRKTGLSTDKKTFTVVLYILERFEWI